MNDYVDDELLMLSGIQHYAFCPRQWALIHLEQQWDDNELTVAGDILHTKVDTPSIEIRLRGKISLRSVPLVSRELGLYGISDVVEFTESNSVINTITLPRHPGFWTPHPVEYKHGEPKRDNVDNLQLCAQAMALEQMWQLSIESGAIYYGKTAHRENVTFDKELRAETIDVAHCMHATYQQKSTPKPIYSPKCERCSIKNSCLPKEISKITSVADYINKHLQ